jgi:RNA-binding protein
LHQLTGAQRKYLRGLAHDRKPVSQVGKQGLADGVIANIDAALGSHELIKVRFQGAKEEKEELSAWLVERLDCVHVGMIGHVLILYRPARDPAKRQIVLP